MSTSPVPAARRGATAIGDERVLAWSEWGPDDGAPVLFSPGAGTSSALGFATDDVDRLGVRLIAIDRPGLGRSTPAPGRTFASFAADIAAFSRARTLGAPAIVGYSQGAPFALACAAAGVVSAVVVVAGTDELAAPAWRDRLPAPLRELIERAEAAPDEAEAIFRTMTPASMTEMIHAASPEVDLAVYRAPGFAAAFAAALGEGFAQGAEGYARDTLLAMRRWTFDPGAIRCPAQLWYGEADASPVHALDRGASLARRIPGATLTVVPGAGGALPWTHGAEILAALRARR